MDPTEYFQFYKYILLIIEQILMFTWASITSITQLAFNCLTLTLETVEQGVKYVRI